MTAYIIISSLVVILLLVSGDDIMYLINKIRSNKDMKELELRSIGLYKTRNKTYNLANYYLDREGNLYSRNPNTWEINPRRGHDILRCSDASRDRSGRIVNSMRTPISGRKVTVARNLLKFDDLKTEVVNFIVTETTPRKYKVERVVL